MVKYEKYETKTGKQRWEYYEYYGLDPKTGKQIRLRGKGFESRTEAKLDYQRKLKNVQDGEKVTAVKKKTFEELLNEYLEYYKDSGIKPGTYKKFKDEMDRYALPEIGKMYISEIDIDDCQTTYNKIRKQRKDHRKIKNQIKTVLDFAITKQYLTTNPMQYILVSKVKTRYKKRRLDSDENYYNPTQLMTFLEAYKEVEEFQKFVYFRLLAFTGLRRGEALALYESDLLKSEKAIKVTKTLTEDENGRDIISDTPKTENSNGIVYLDDDTYAYIVELINNRNEYDNYGKVTYIHNNKYLFVSPKTKKHYSRSMPNDWLKNFFDRNEEALKKRGLHRISPHGLRHSQATLLFELGVDPKNAQYRLRHKNLKTTMDIYTHLSEQQKQAPTQQLNAFSATVPTSVPTFSEATKKQR
ncbi:tyrosine-type recombinase/integrase [Jeotgalibaca porci]|uniref:tyrosine-type recombinase/integrase n=1 Tax=Jeotgalibaca porci TaxID=1868793 RepID=UPI0035A037F6